MQRARAPAPVRPRCVGIGDRPARGAPRASKGREKLLESAPACRWVSRWAPTPWPAAARSPPLASLPSRLRPRLVDSRTEFPRTEASVRGKSVRGIVAGKGSHAFFSAHRTFPCAERGARTKSSAHGGVRARTLSRVPRTAIGRPPTAMAGKRKPAGEPTERMKAPKEWSSLENVAAMASTLAVAARRHRPTWRRSRLPPRTSTRTSCRSCSTRARIGTARSRSIVGDLR